MLFVSLDHACRLSCGTAGFVSIRELLVGLGFIVDDYYGAILDAANVETGAPITHDLPTLHIAAGLDFDTALCRPIGTELLVLGGAELLAFLLGLARVCRDFFCFVRHVVCSFCVCCLAPVIP